MRREVTIPKFDLPDRTKVDKFIPKTKIIPRLTNGKKILNDVEKMFLSYKLSPTTININSTKKVEEILIITVTLKSYKVPKPFLIAIQKIISYPVLFVFKYCSNFCYSISLLDEKRNYVSKWNEKKSFVFTGIDLERVYQEIVISFLSNITETNKKNNHSFKKLIDIDSQLNIIKMDIGVLKRNIRSEKQLNKQMELNTELRKKRFELKECEEK